MRSPTSPVPARAVPTRRVSFEYPLADLPRHFAADADPVRSHVLATLSAVFPNGEDFFVRSVRRYRDQITDPELAHQVKGFIGQEAIHGREHRELNDRLDELGYPTKRIDHLVEVSLRLRERVAPASANLALTAALEHWTATLAETLMTDAEVRGSIGHPEVTSLFMWHALEESEHKAVAFDVYRAVGGSERLRVWTMRLIILGFPIFILVTTLITLLRDPVARRQPRKVWQGWKRLRRSALVSRDMLDKLADYNRPDFHPDDRDTAALVDQWREQLFGEAGSLTDRLPSAS